MKSLDPEAPKNLWDGVLVVSTALSKLLTEKAVWNCRIIMRIIVAWGIVRDIKNW